MICPLSWWRVNIPVAPSTGWLSWLFLAIIRILPEVAADVVEVVGLSIGDEEVAGEMEVVLSLVD